MNDRREFDESQPVAVAVAASGVQGLSTIVPISAIASYYDYTRTNGVIQRGNNYLASLAIP